MGNSFEVWFLVTVLCLISLECSELGGAWTEPKSQCERITIPLCQDLGYNWTVMPNLMGNNNQKEAEEAMSVYAPLLASECSPHARFFLCSAFAPLCSEHVVGAVGGCRGLCERVWAACEPQLRRLPAAAAAPLACTRFPDRADRRLCMRPPNASEPASPPPPDRWPFPDDADVAPEARDPSCPPAFVRAPGGECAPACGRDAPYRPEDRRVAELWIAVAAWASLLSTAFAAFTFCVDPSRYRYPERPVVFLATCHAFVAGTHLVGCWLGPRAITCAGPTLAVDGLSSAPCVAFFSVTYYFTLAADAWFLNACVAWYLTAASEWSTEALERASAYFHAAAWGWAGAWTAAALALRRVAAEELTGACGVADSAAAALVGVPRGALLCAAGALALGAAPGVRRVRRALDARGAARVGRFAARAGAAAALYWTAAALATGARVWLARRREARGGLALLAAMECGAGGEACAGGAGAGGDTAAAALAVLSGAAAGAWAWGRKSGAVWRRALCPPRKATPLLPPRCPPPQPLSAYKRPPLISRV